ncbi:TBPIP-domain-containing protein [Suillus ampliporus]|nr:TBPIP-domain-containing protein [Suillus ampliporus]
MTSKAKSSDVKVLKGQEAEDAILQYLKRMNRPFGAVDVAANLKGAVPKATTQKILVVLAEKGEIVQKTCFFVANQTRIDAVSADRLTELEIECKTIEESNNVLAAEVKIMTAELSKLKNCPTDEELDAQIAGEGGSNEPICPTFVPTKIAQLTQRLISLRSGAPLISAEELAKVDAACIRFPPQDSNMLVEDLAIEFDSTEHNALEKGPLCAIQGTNTRSNLKRKRV